MLKPRYKNDATILAHEFVHVAQHDRLGREAFLRRYLVELVMMGYARAPLELEASERQNAIESISIIRSATALRVALTNLGCTNDVGPNTVFAR